MHQIGRFYPINIFWCKFPFKATASMSQPDPTVKKVGYVFNKELLFLANRLPEIRGRAGLVHQLIAAYGILKDCYHIDVAPSSETELRKFHTVEYIDFVKKISNSDDPNDALEDEECEVFGLSYDCPPIPQLFRTISYLASSSIEASKAIINKRCHIVVNWFGGWHHGYKDEASGFCYTNDIIFAILTFLESGYKQILYVDMDLHHGNAVEDAFSHTDKVVTLSIHKNELGFFPGSGDISDIGLGSRGKYYSINVPLKDGIDDEQYMTIFDNIITRLIPKYRPQVIICQCGADSLNGDRMNSFNLTLKSYEHCVKLLISYNIPIIFLGGGGYNLPNTARLWTTLTALTLDKILDINIPDHDLFLHYGPSYELSVDRSLRPNQNEHAKIVQYLEIINDNIDRIKN